MFFIILTFFAALFIEGLGSLVSVIGISALFGANPIIIALAIALDVGKVVTVSLLYTHWKSLSKLMKTYALLAATVTMIITSAGAAGYLTGEFQKSIMATREGDLKVSVLKEQQAKYELRKKQIDDQIAALPARTTVNQRLRMVRAFQAEQKALDEKIAEIDQKLPELQVAQIGTEAKAGPIVSISKAFKIPMEEAVSWVIGMIIFVFDPLAIFLIIAGNFLWAQRKAQQAVPEPIVDADAQERLRKANEHFDDRNLRASAPEVMREASPPEPVAPVTIHRPLPEGEIADVEVEPPVDAEPETEFPKHPKKDDIFFHTVEKQMYIFDGERWVGANTLAFTTPEPVAETTYETFHEPVVEPEPIVEPAPVKEERPEFQQSGLLKPVKVEASDEADVIIPDDSGMIPMKVSPAPIHREEITKSTLGIVEPDPNTIVDAARHRGFRKATSVK